MRQGKVGLLRSLSVLLLSASCLAAGPAAAITLKVAVALESNPEIGQAIENREAIEFELRQAKGLYLPSVDLEASAGARGIDTRSSALDDEPLYPTEASIIVRQTLYDSGARRSEVN